METQNDEQELNNHQEEELLFQNLEETYEPSVKVEGQQESVSLEKAHEIREKAILVLRYVDDLFLKQSIEDIDRKISQVTDAISSEDSKEIESTLKSLNYSSEELNNLLLNELPQRIENLQFNQAWEDVLDDYYGNEESQSKYFDEYNQEKIVYLYKKSAEEIKADPFYQILLNARKNTDFFSMPENNDHEKAYTHIKSQLENERKIEINEIEVDNPVILEQFEDAEKHNQKQSDQLLNQKPEDIPKKKINKNSKFHFDPTAHHDGEQIVKQFVKQSFNNLKKVSIMENQEQKPKYDNEIKVDDLVSVPFNKGYLKGIVTDVNEKEITLSNYEKGSIKVANNSDIHKFFNGQKYDVREVAPVMDKALKNTSVGTYYELPKKDRARLLAGYMTQELVKGQSLSEGENGTKTIKEWEAKFQLFKNKDGSLKVSPHFKQEKLSANVYGKEVTKEQMETLQSGQKLVLERETKQGNKFKCIASLDKDLNSIVTEPHTEKKELKIKEYVEKAQQKEQKQKTGQKVQQPEAGGTEKKKVVKKSKAEKPAKAKKQSL